MCPDESIEISLFGLSHVFHAWLTPSPCLAAVMVLVSVHAQRETMLGRLAVPMGTTDGALLDQWFELRAR